MKEIWAELGYRGLFAGTHLCGLMLSKNTMFALLKIVKTCVFHRFHAQGDQSGPSLCCYDKHLRVRKGLLPKGEPWSRVTGILKAVCGVLGVPQRHRIVHTAAHADIIHQDSWDKVSSNRSLRNSRAWIWFCVNPKEEDSPTRQRCLPLQICSLEILTQTAMRLETHTHAWT